MGPLHKIVTAGFFFINHLPSRSLIIPIAPFRIAVSLSTVSVITSFPRFTLIGMMSGENLKFATSFNDIFSTLSGEYLRKFSKKFEMALLGYPWVWRGKMIKKKPEVKNLDTLSLYAHVFRFALLNSELTLYVLSYLATI